MISIVIAMRSLWACKILNGDKKIEVRKGLALYNALKKAEERGEEVEFLMYVTKAKPYLLDRRVVSNGEYEAITLREMHDENSTVNITPKSGCVLNGKVVARFKAKAEEIKYRFVRHSFDEYATVTFVTETLSQRKLLMQSCLPYFDLRTYLGIENERDGKSVGTALHIEDLEIFDKPKTLADYGLKRAPESWCYAKEARQ